MSGQWIKVWVSKYALTDGVVEQDARDLGAGCVMPAGFIHWITLGKDAHLTREAALQVAEAMRLKKIASLEKQLKKLKEMRFE